MELTIRGSMLVQITKVVKKELIGNHTLGEIWPSYEIGEDNANKTVNFTSGDYAYCFSMTFKGKSVEEAIKDIDTSKPFNNFNTKPSYDSLAELINTYETQCIQFEDEGYCMRLRPDNASDPLEGGDVVVCMYDNMTGAWDKNKHICKGYDVAGNRYYVKEINGVKYLVIGRVGSNGRPKSETYLIKLGSDGKAYGTTFIPVDTPWETCLLNQSAFQKVLDVLNND